MIALMGEILTQTTPLCVSQPADRPRNAVLCMLSSFYAQKTTLELMHRRPLSWEHARGVLAVLVLICVVVVLHQLLFDIPVALPGTDRELEVLLCDRVPELNVWLVKYVANRIILTL